MNFSKPTTLEAFKSLVEQISFNDDGNCQEIGNLINLTVGGKNNIQVVSFDKEFLKGINRNYEPLKARLRLLFLLELFGCDVTLEKERKYIL